MKGEYLALTILLIRVSKLLSKRLDIVIIVLSKELKTRVVIRAMVIIILTLSYEVISKLNIKSLL